MIDKVLEKVGIDLHNGAPVGKRGVHVWQTAIDALREVQDSQVEQIMGIQQELTELHKKYNTLLDEHHHLQHEVAEYRLRERMGNLDCLTGKDAHYLLTGKQD